MRLGLGMALALCMLAAVCAWGQAKPPLRIAAAADLQPVMPALAAAYEKKTGVKLEVSFGSSGTLATQILNGAPVDVFLGADFSFPEKIVAAGLATEKSPVPYAKGTLVLAARKDSPITPLQLERLTDPRVEHVAIADEFHAPYGRAAYAALRGLKLEAAVRAKAVSAENVAQAAQLVLSGNAQAGFISLTLAMSPALRDTLQYVRVPRVYPEIRQCGVVIKASPQVAEAERFLLWMQSPEVQGHLADFGLEPVR